MNMFLVYVGKEDCLILDWVGKNANEEMDFETSPRCDDHLIPDIPEKPGMYIYECTITFPVDVYESDPEYNGKWRNLTDKELKSLADCGSIW